MTNSDTQPDDIGAQPIPSEPPKKGRALSRLKRELTDEEMASSGTQKMILDSIEQLQQEVEELKGFRDKYYEADKKIGILQEKAKTKIALEVLSTGSIAVGGGALAFSRTVWADPNGLGMMLAIFGAVMTGVGIAAKVILR